MRKKGCDNNSYFLFQGIFGKEWNSDYLSKNYETDVISFDFSNDNKISGDIYISSETVKKNSIIFNVCLIMN